MSKINGKVVKNDQHMVGPYPVVRYFDEEVEVAVLDQDDKPVIDEATGKPKTKTEVQSVKHVYGIFAVPVWSYDEFDRLYPRPQPPVGGWSKDGKKPDFRDPQYLQDIEDWHLAREGWSMMTSLAPSNIELDGVDMKDPRTWSSIKPKLIELFSYFEYNEIVKLMDEACGIDADKIAENRESFLSERQARSSERTKA